MNFPSFVVTGPATDIPVAPMQYPTLNLMPVIQALRRPAATSKKATASTGKKDEPTIEATRGSSIQWQNEYDANQSKLRALLNFYGEEAVNRPEYKSLISQEEYLTSPGLKQVLKRNLEEVEKLKTNIGEKDASGLIHIGMGLRGMGFKSADDWYAQQQNAATSITGQLKPGQIEFIENFESDYQFYDTNDFLDESQKIFAASQDTEYAYDEVNNNIDIFKKGDLAGLLKTYNKKMVTMRSNYNKYGEDSKDPNNKGQLGSAYEEVWARAGQEFGTLDMSDKITQGSFQSFLQKTIGNVVTGKPRSTSEKQAFQKRLDLLYENEKDEADRRQKELKGYYYKEGVKDENGNDLSGQIDINAFMNDYQRNTENHLNRLFGLNRRSVLQENEDEQLTFYNENDSQTSLRLSKRNADIFAQGAVQSNESSATVTDQGYSEDGLMKLIGYSGSEEEEDKNIFEKIGDSFKGLYNLFTGQTSDEVTDTELRNLSINMGANSPFDVSVSSDGTAKYKPKPAGSWDEEMYKYNLWQILKKEHPDWTDTDINDEVEKVYSKVHNVWSIAHDRRYETSEFGVERFDQNWMRWTVDGVPDAFKKQIYNSFFNETNPVTGEKVLKTAGNTLQNSDAKIGDDVVNAGSYFGDMVIYSTSNDIHLGAAGLPGNAAFKVIAENGLQLGNKKYPKGKIVPLSVLDPLSTDKAKELISNKQIDIGSGYWDYKTGRDKQRPDRSTMQPSGNTSINILTGIYGVDSDNPQFVTNAPAQFYTNTTYTGKKADVIKNFSNKQFYVDAPAYTQDADGEKAYQYALSKAKTRPEKGTNNSSAIDLIKYNADQLGLKGKLRSDYIKECTDVINKRGHVRKSELAIIGGKYYGMSVFTTDKSWDSKPVLQPKNIIVNGDFDERYKSLTKFQEKDGNVFITAKTNVTAALNAITDKEVSYYTGASYREWINGGGNTKTSQNQNQGQNIYQNYNPKK